MHILPILCHFTNMIAVQDSHTKISIIEDICPRVDIGYGFADGNWGEEDELEWSSLYTKIFVAVYDRCWTTLFFIQEIHCGRKAGGYATWSTGDVDGPQILVL